METCTCKEPADYNMFGVRVCMKCDGMVSDDAELTEAAVNMGRIMGAFN